MCQRRQVHDIRRGGHVAELQHVDDRRAIRVQRIDRNALIQHRVAKAIDRIGEFRRDGGIKVNVVVAEEMDRRRNLPREFLEHEMLVLRFRAKLRGLEDPLAIPFIGRDDVRRIAQRPDPVHHAQHSRIDHPVCCECRIATVHSRLDQCLRQIDEAVVFGMEYFVNRRQAHVLVHATVAGNVVRVEQLVIIGSSSLWQELEIAWTNRIKWIEQRIRKRSGNEVGIHGQRQARRCTHRRRSRRNVIEEGMVDENGIARQGRRTSGVHLHAGIDGNGQRARVDHDDGTARRSVYEIAIRIRLQKRHVSYIQVSQDDTELQRIGLEVSPRRHAILP